MPRPDPVPSANNALRKRFWRIFRVLALLSVAIGALSAAIIAHGDTTFHIHMLLATALGTGLSVLVGGALMTLVFLSASSGHDHEAASPPDQEID